jgi:hypothetical protein
MIRRHIRSALAACSCAVFCGRSPAQAGSRGLEEHNSGICCVEPDGHQRQQAAFRREYRCWSASRELLVRPRP